MNTPRPPRLGKDDVTRLFLNEWGVSIKTVKKKLTKAGIGIAHGEIDPFKKEERLFVKSNEWLKARDILATPCPSCKPESEKYGIPYSLTYNPLYKVFTCSHCGRIQFKKSALTKKDILKRLTTAALLAQREEQYEAQAAHWPEQERATKFKELFLNEIEKSFGHDGLVRVKAKQLMPALHKLQDEYGAAYMKQFEKKAPSEEEGEGEE